MLHRDYEIALEVLAAENVPCDFDQLDVEAKLAAAVRESVHPEKTRLMLDLWKRVIALRETVQRGARWLLESTNSKAVRYFVLAAKENFSAIEPPPRIGEARMLTSVPVEELTVHELHTLANYFLTAVVYGLSHDENRRKVVANFEERLNTAGLHEAAEYAFEAGNSDAIAFVAMLHEKIFAPSGIPLRLGGTPNDQGET